MGIQAPSKVKFGIIYDCIKNDSNVLSISYMCELAGVSRSGFYEWLKAAPARELRDERDRQDFELILDAFRFRGYAKGARSIHMRLLHTGVIMNVKKIRRLMKKYDLICPIRKANPYRRMAKALATNNTAQNIVNRDFKREPRKVLLTDITYLFYGNEKCYLSTILDAFTHEILAYKVSISFKVDFVLDDRDFCRFHDALHKAVYPQGRFSLRYSRIRTGCTFCPIQVHSTLQTV